MQAFGQCSVGRKDNQHINGQCADLIGFKTQSTSGEQNYTIDSFSCCLFYII